MISSRTILRLLGAALLGVTLLPCCLAATPSALDDELDAPADNRSPATVDETHPLYSNDARWVTTLLVAVGGFFLAALVIGPIVRAEAPQVVPPAMSHEEDPAADQVGHSDPQASSPHGRALD